MSNTHADKRSVSTDALDTLGMIIGPNEKRDAIHLAVEPVTASQWMEPGDPINFIYGSKRIVEVVSLDNSIGIVDPFLTTAVEKGQRFWLVVHPRQITSLRHVWSHPAFEDEVFEEEAQTSPLAARLEFKKELDGTNQSIRWIADYAESVGLEYDELMDAATDWVDSREHSDWGEYLNRGELLDGVSLSNEFWTHYEKVTGKEVNPAYQENFFTCSC